MQDIGQGKEAIRSLKSHDAFLTELKLLNEKEQDGIRQDIEDKIHLTQTVTHCNSRYQRR